MADEVAAGTFDPHRPGHGDQYNHALSRRIGAKGWIGMTWPKKYGGRERSFLERYVVTEEFRVANAPVRLHFVADRQSGPILMWSRPGLPCLRSTTPHSRQCLQGQRSAAFRSTPASR